MPSSMDEMTSWLPSWNGQGVTLDVAKSMPLQGKPSAATWLHKSCDPATSAPRRPGAEVAFEPNHGSGNRF